MWTHIGAMLMIIKFFFWSFHACSLAMVNRTHRLPIPNTTRHDTANEISTKSSRQEQTMQCWATPIQSVFEKKISRKVIHLGKSNCRMFLLDQNYEVTSNPKSRWSNKALNSIKSWRLSEKILLYAIWFVSWLYTTYYMSPCYKMTSLEHLEKW